MLTLIVGEETLVDMKAKNENKLKCLYCNKLHLLTDQDFNEIIDKKNEENIK